MTDSPTPVAVPRGRARDLALVATFAAFVAVSAVLPAIPLPGIPVPLTLQTFAVLLAGLVLGPARGAAAIGLYLLIGLAGLPVFAGGAAGPAVLAGPSAGYLLAFLPAAAVAGWLVRALHRVRGSGVPGRAGRGGGTRHASAVRASVAALVAGLLVVHPPGIAVLGWRLGLSAGEAVVAGLPFLPGDALKAVLAGVVAAAVLRAYPDLLRARRAAGT